jgi:microcystin-dependent protein
MGALDINELISSRIDPLIRELERQSAEIETFSALAERSETADSFPPRLSTKPGRYDGQVAFLIDQGRCAVRVAGQWLKFDTGTASTQFLADLLDVSGAAQTDGNVLMSTGGAFLARLLEHSKLSDDEPEKHRLIDDEAETATNLWSASKIAGLLTTIDGDENDFVSLDADGYLQSSGIKVIDEDSMASNSDEHVPTQQSVKAYVDAAGGGGGGSTPPGVMAPYAGSSAPSGWLLCYGQALSRTTYADLFAAIGTDYGVGDGSTTFNLPDLRGRVWIGLDNMGGSSANRVTDAAADSIGGTLGEEVHTLTTGEMPSHTHTTPSLLGIWAGSGPGLTAGGSYSPTTPRSATNAEGGGGAHNNMQPGMAGNVIIKT